MRVSRFRRQGSVELCASGGVGEWWKYEGGLVKGAVCVEWVRMDSGGWLESGGGPWHWETRVSVAGSVAAVYSCLWCSAVQCSRMGEDRGRDGAARSPPDQDLQGLVRHFPRAAQNRHYSLSISNFASSQFIPCRCHALPIGKLMCFAPYQFLRSTIIQLF